VSTEHDSPWVDSSRAESLGLTVCRLGLDPTTGRIAHPDHLGIAIRGALFAELVLDGRLRGVTVPRVDGPSETGNRLADSVHRAVSGRGPMPWKRWFSHVGADLEAATGALVEGGAWQVQGPKRYADTDPELTAAQAARVAEILRHPEPGPAADEIVVALLVGAAGPRGDKPRPRARLAQVDPLLPLHPEIKERQESARAALRAALRAIRGRAFLRLLSG
jgi:hypothetical protein